MVDCCERSQLICTYIWNFDCASTDGARDEHRRIIPVNNWFNYSVDGMSIFLSFALRFVPPVWRCRAPFCTANATIPARSMHVSHHTSSADSLGSNNHIFGISFVLCANRFSLCGTRCATICHLVYLVALSLSLCLFFFLWPTPSLGFKFVSAAIYA